VGAGAQPSPAHVDAFAPKPRLTLRPVVAYPAGGDRSVATWQYGAMSVSTDLESGEPSFALFGSGSVKAPAFCQAVTSGGPSLESVSDAGAYWRVEGRLVEQRQSGAVVDLRWQRVVRQPDIYGDPLDVARRVYLAEGAPVTLDFVHLNPARFSDGCESIAVTIEYAVSPAPQVANEAIEYDMWLLQTDGAGSPREYRFRTAGMNGERIQFTYPSAFYDLDGNPVTRGEGRRIEMVVNGSIRGWLREDGSIDVTVSSARFYWGVPRSIGTGGGGAKQLTLGAGETVEFELPGQLTGDLPGVSDLNSIFAQHRTAIRITARRLW
jgi:hypothetical protein